MARTRIALVLALVALPGCQLTIPNGLVSGLQGAVPTAAAAVKPGPSPKPSTAPRPSPSAIDAGAAPLGPAEPELPAKPPEPGLTPTPRFACDETFDRLDTARDARLSLDELLAWAAVRTPTPDPKEVFRKVDFDRDGKLAPDEFCGFAELWPITRDAGSKAPPVPDELPVGPQLGPCALDYQVADERRDGRVTFDEYRAFYVHMRLVALPPDPASDADAERLKTSFARQDRDHDGAIDAAEWCTAPPVGAGAPPPEGGLW